MDMFTSYTFQHLDLTLSAECEEDDIFEIAQKLRPDWKQPDVRIIIKMTSGMFFTCSLVHHVMNWPQEDDKSVCINFLTIFIGHVQQGDDVFDSIWVIRCHLD